MCFRQFLSLQTKQDIFLFQITGTTDYAKIQLDMLFSQCIAEVEKYDIVTDDPDSNYTNPYQELFESVCYSDCNGNGICENGNKNSQIMLSQSMTYIKSKNLPVLFI